MLYLCIYDCIYICLSIHRHALFCFSFTKILCLDTALALKILCFFKTEDWWLLCTKQVHGCHCDTAFFFN